MSRRKFIKNHANKRLLRMKLIIRIVILIMGVIVLYDAFIYKTPLYYMLFWLCGALLGNFFNISYKVIINEESLKISLTNNFWSIVFLVLILLIRFVIGKSVLQSFNVVLITDALYLFSMGIYYSKWKVIIKQIDNLYYQILSKLKEK